MSATKQDNSEEAFLDTSHWVKGRWYRYVQPLLERSLAISRINALANDAHHPGMAPEAFADEVLQRLGVGCHFYLPELPSEATHGWLVLANHPTGFIEALVLMRAMHQLAPNHWHLLGNEFVAEKTQLNERVIGLDPFLKKGGRRANIEGLREAARRLRNGEMIGAFPAGRVSAKRDSSGRAIDQTWSPHFLRLARSSGARIVLINMPWTPGRTLRWMPTRFPALRAMLLSREAFRHNATPVEVTARLAPTGLAEDLEEGTNQLKTFCHELPPT